MKKYLWFHKFDLFSDVVGDLVEIMKKSETDVTKNYMYR